MTKADNVRCTNVQRRFVFGLLCSQKHSQNYLRFVSLNFYKHIAGFEIHL